MHLSFPELTLWAHKTGFAKWSVSGRGTLRPSWMVGILGGGEKREPDSLVTKRIKELSMEWMESSETQLISKVIGFHPQTFATCCRCTLMRLLHLLHPKPSGPDPELLSMALTPSDNSTHDVIFGFFQKSFKTLKHRSLQRTVSCKPHRLPKMWVAGQTPLLKSHSENTEIQAVAWYSTNECLDSMLGLCSCMRSLFIYEQSSTQEVTVTRCPAETASECTFRPLIFLLEEASSIFLFDR